MWRHYPSPQTCSDGLKCVEIQCPLLDLDSTTVMVLHSRLWNATFLEVFICSENYRKNPDWLGVWPAALHLPPSLGLHFFELPVYRGGRLTPTNQPSRQHWTETRKAQHAGKSHKENLRSSLFPLKCTSALNTPSTCLVNSQVKVTVFLKREDEYIATVAWWIILLTVVALLLLLAIPVFFWWKVNQINWLWGLIRYTVLCFYLWCLVCDFLPARMHATAEHQAATFWRWKRGESSSNRLTTCHKANIG